MRTYELFRSEISEINVNKRSKRAIAIATINVLNKTLFEMFLSTRSPNIDIKPYLPKTSCNLNKMQLSKKINVKKLNKLG